MSDHVKAWQCIGCGKIEAPQTCIGVCQDRKVEFVYAFEHEDALAQLDAALSRANALEAFVRRLARTKPHDGEWEHCYRRFQVDARELLATPALGHRRDAANRA
jgi:hypothetical protein